MFKNKIAVYIILVVAVTALAGGSFWAGFVSGERHPQNLIVQGAINIAPGDPAVGDFSTFWQAWQMINDNYLRNKSVTGSAKIYGAIDGLVRSLGDPYSQFFPPTENKKFQEDVQGNFGGIGAELGVQNGQLVVIAPLKDTPASRAGLKSGDRILGINASSTEGMGVDEAVNFIRGPQGSEVTLTILRQGWDKPRDFKIKRDTITVPTLDFEMKGNVAYIALHSFNANADGLFYDAVTKAKAGGAKGLILDLRDNPGGYLDVAVDLAGWFLKPGTLVVSEAGRSGPGEELRANGNASLLDMPVAILVNGGSASASEILAGALRDQRRIKLVGEQTFGKGTVQQLLMLKDDSSIKLTIAHWVLPSGQILENGGLEPDIEVKMTDQDVMNKKDPQLDKALELLK